MTGYNKKKLEQEAFDFRLNYEKNLSSNGGGLNGMAFMVFLSVFALIGCDKIPSSLNQNNSKEKIEFSSQKIKNQSLPMLKLKKSSDFRCCQTREG